MLLGQNVDFYLFWYKICVHGMLSNCEQASNVFDEFAAI